jgi:NADPH:quinone reductase
MKAIHVIEYGGPDVLRVVELASPRLGAGQLVVRPAAIGVNFTDVYARTGASRGLPPPFILGSEGAGIVSAVASDVQSPRVGDRVAWKTARGGYASEVLIDAAEAVPVPSELSLEDAAAALLQGLTAHYLTTSTYRIEGGDIALVHAGGGGTGRLIIQMVRARDGTVVATTSTDEKAALAMSSGASHVVRYDHDVAASVRQITEGQGVSVVYDGVGRATFEASLASLRTRGMLVAYGMSSGPIPPFDLQRLRTGSLFVTRPTLVDYTRTREELLRRSDAVFGMLMDGRLKLHIGGRYPLREAATAHADLESRRTSGKLLLIPE